ncbi:hypothetical protein DTL42_16280 [Bremerella cremea]|uniref:Uncharacterized protein n=1 Tax=Bremerella cremea TaxID=1031537 RepID=A0A368KNN6_9BACT|nr:hypothetical protein DTL42_16280 [Bremerella cremea]
MPNQISRGTSREPTQLANVSEAATQCTAAKRYDDARNLRHLLFPAVEDFVAAIRLSFPSQEKFTHAISNI